MDVRLDHGPAPRRPAGGGLAPWQAELAAEVLTRDLAVEVRAEDLAGLCGLSRSHFAKAFKATMGAPPHRWIVRQRLRRAAELLERTDEPISVIAVACGFADQSHLTRVFRGAAGMSPGAWRRWRRAGA